MYTYIYIYIYGAGALRDWCVFKQCADDTILNAFAHCVQTGSGHTLTPKK